MRQALKDSSLGFAARAVAVAALFSLDRLTKLWAVKCLKPLFMIPIFPFFRLSYVENTGMAFGLGAQRNRFFLVTSVALLLVLLYLQKAWSKKNAWIQIGLLLILSGALGNVYDRWFYGHVVDFLDFRIWPVFNVADSCVSIGAVCLGIGLLKEEAAEKHRQSQATS